MEKVVEVVGRRRKAIRFCIGVNRNSVKVLRPIMTRIRRWIEMALSCSQSRRAASYTLSFVSPYTMYEASLLVLVEFKESIYEGHGQKFLQYRGMPCKMAPNWPKGPCRVLATCLGCPVRPEIVKQGF